MELWREMTSERASLVKMIGAGLAVYLLMSITLAWSQEATPAPAAAPAVASTPSVNATAPSGKVGTSVTDYTVSPEDLLDIVVMDVPEVSRTYRVSSNGLLTLPLLTEPINTEGQTLDQLAHLISSKFRDAGMLNNAQVSISLKETRLHAVLISGEVRAPGSYPIYGPTRLIDLLVKAGGILPTAGDDAVVTRAEAGARADAAASAKTGEPSLSDGSRPFTLNIRKLVDSGDDTANINLYPGDRVTIQRAELIYVLGAVGRPGGYVLNDSRQQITILKALALAGDVSSIAKRGHIRILRRDPAGHSEERQEIPVNYPAIAKGKMDDIRLVADDIVFVPESTGLKALHASTQAAVSVAATGGSALLIYH